MQLKFLTRETAWRGVADAARTTVRLPEGEKEPTSAWKRRIILSEHSPVRKLMFRWKWVDLKYWVSVHFVRHKHGIEHFVSTQRTDRTGIGRDDAPQGALVEHECFANAQEIVYISRKRLCAQASPETRDAWKTVLDALEPLEPELHSVCVPECVYRGFCPEFKPCGYADSPAFAEALAKYRGA